MRSTNASTRVSPLWDNVVVRLALYYAGTFSFFLGMVAVFPSIIEFMDLERLRVVTSAQDLFGAAGGEAGASLYSTTALLRPERVVPVLVSMFGALALALPVSWVYAWTREEHKTRQGVARALVVLPIAIAFVVFLVKGSLPLAFSLAGIVAAVRFRTSLNDTTDAVFLFVVIGIGLSAGVQLLSVAFIASELFAGVALVVWGTRFAENPSQLEGLRLVRPSPAGLHPSSSRPNPRKGEWTDGGAPGIVLLVHASDPEQAERLADLVFGQYAKDWRLVGVSDGDGGARILRYLVRLKNRFGPTTAIEAIRAAGGASILKVESVPD